MKKKLSGIFLLLLMSLTLLVACGEEPDTPGGQGNGELKENAIFNETSELYIIRDSAIGDGVDRFFNELFSQRIEPPRIDAPNSEKKDHEIVFGDSDRQISSTALARLDRIEKNNDDERSFLIYSDGSSLAVVWEDDDDGLIFNMVIDYLCENFAVGEYVAPAGVIYSETVDLVEYYRAQDEAYKTELWTDFEEANGKELTDAYKQLYAIYSEDCILWLANLYDPDICVCVDLYGEAECTNTKYCGTGGWYYSNSARDTMGYLPDAESTNQALNFLSSAGLASQREGGYLSVITAEMKQQIGDFIYSLEEENGYFYHPQWGREFTDTKISRRARDLSWCCTILSNFGRTPKYTTASGMKGEDVLGTSHSLTDRLGADRVAMVSKVVLVNDAYASHLQDLDSFKAYLASLDLRNRSYNVGNELTAQTPQITERDRQIGTEDDPTPLMDYLIEWLNAGQNPETGNWDWKKPGDTGYQDYYGTNGLLKISGIYETHGVVMPHTREAVLSATADIINPAEIGAVVDLYNTWFAIENLINNLKQNGGEEGELEAERIYGELREIAPEAIIVSRDKIVDFLKPDGSASYGRLYSSSTSQGCPAAVPNSVEGDVNGSTIAINGIIGHSMAALGFDKVPLFGEAARYLFRKEIASLSPIVKNDDTQMPEPFDFEYDEVGYESEDLEIDHYGGSGTALVIADPTGAGNGKVTEIVSNIGAGDSIRVPCQNATSLANTFIFEGDFYLESTDSSYPVQITLGGAYMLTLRIKGGKIELWEASSASGNVAIEEYLGATVEKEKWFRVRAEYYYGDESTVRIKFYCDTDLSDGKDEMKLYAITDNYYDPQGEKVTSGTGKPSSSFTSTNIYVMSSASIKMYIDNVNSYRSKLGYSESLSPDDHPYTNIDANPEERLVYDFNDGNIHSDIVTNIVGDKVTVDSDNRLAVNGSADVSTLKVPMTIREKGAKCGYVSFKLRANSSSTGNIMTLTAMDDTLKMFSIDLIGSSDSEGSYITAQPVGVATGPMMDSFRIPVGKEVTVEIAYYHNEDVAIIYVDGKFAGSSTYLYENANKYTMDSLLISTAANIYSVTLDDIIVEKTAALFEDAVAPNTGDKLYDFSEEHEDVVISGNTTTVVGGKLNMNVTSNAKQSVKFPINKRADLINSVVLQFDIKYNKTAVGTAHILKLTDSNDNLIVSYELVLNGDKIELYEVSRGGRVQNPICTFKASDTLSLKLEIYHEQRMIHIFNGQSIVGKSSIFAGEEYFGNGFASFVIESGTAKTNASVDNLKCETVYNKYVVANISGSVNPENDLTAGLTFESSNSGSLPSSIGNKLYNSNYIMIQNVKNDVTDAYSNVFVFNKNSGGNDEFSFGTNGIDGSSSCIAFETDIKIDTDSNDTLFRLYFGEDGRKNSAYFLNVNVSGGNIVLLDVSNAGDGANLKSSVSAGVSKGEWFNFRVEYYKGTKDTVRIKIYINGECVGVSDNFAGGHASSTPLSSISSVTLYCMGAFRGSVYMDNVSLSGSDGVCTDKVTMTKQ